MHENIYNYNVCDADFVLTLYKMFQYCIWKICINIQTQGETDKEKIDKMWTVIIMSNVSLCHSYNPHLFTFFYSCQNETVYLFKLKSNKY